MHFVIILTDSKDIFYFNAWFFLVANATFRGVLIPKFITLFDITQYSAVCQGDITIYIQSYSDLVRRCTWQKQARDCVF